MRAKKATVETPKNEKEAAQFVATIGKCQRRIEGIEIKMNERIEKIKENYNGQTEEIHEELNEALEGLFIYCNANREVLTPRGKTKSWPTGDVSWRMTPPKVGVRDKAKVISHLKQLKLSDFVRIKEDINKEAILADPERVAAVKGIAISQTEEFVVRPAEVRTEVTKSRKLN